MNKTLNIKQRIIVVDWTVIQNSNLFFAGQCYWEIPEAVSKIQLKRRSKILSLSSSLFPIRLLKIIIPKPQPPLTVVCICA